MAAHATSRSTIGALLGTVSVAAHSVTKGISVIDTGFSMAKTAADDAARRQSVRSKIDAEVHTETILKEKTMELELQNESINEWLAEKDDRAARFNSTYARLEAALNGKQT